LDNVRWLVHSEIRLSFGAFSAVGRNSPARPAHTRPPQGARHS